MDLHDEDAGLVPTLQTARLCLRPITTDDIDAIATAMSVGAVTRWLTLVPVPYARADAEEFVTVIAREPGTAHWAIDEGAGLIGVISVKPDLGYWLAASHHGQGLMTEAAQAAVAWHFAQTARPLASGYHLGNGPSAAILTKLGFRPTEIEEVMPRSGSGPVQLQRMCLTHENWEARHG